MRTPLSVALLAAAALAATGCGSSGGTGGPGPSPGLVPGQVNLKLPNYNPCSIDPAEKKVVIDWEQYAGGKPKEVTWKRTNGKKKVYFLPSVDEKHPFLFPTLIGTLEEYKYDHASGVPTIPANWTGWEEDADNDPESYTFRYVVVYRGEECDPDICIRKNAGGCN